MTHEIARAFDAEACRCADKSRKAGVSGTSRIILDALSEFGISGKTVLELGCGVGGLAVELLRRGAAQVHGLDLSPQSITQARELASAEGFDGKARFTVGDAAEADLKPGDVVILDKVICCYPEMSDLLENSLEACRGYYCVALPQDKGAWGVLQRLLQPLETAYFWLRRCGFRSYLHSADEMDRRVREKGFDTVFSRTSWWWLITVYSKTSRSQ